MLRIAFDIGGTFTDFVLHDTTTGRIDIWKVPTTPKEPAKAVLDSLAARAANGKLVASKVQIVLHATTVPPSPTQISCSDILMTGSSTAAR